MPPLTGASGALRTWHGGCLTKRDAQDNTRGRWLPRIIFLQPLPSTPPKVCPFLENMLSFFDIPELLL